MKSKEIELFLTNCPKPFVIILVGIPLSGKDTFLRSLNNLDYVEIKVEKLEDELFEISDKIVKIKVENVDCGDEITCKYLKCLEMKLVRVDILLKKYIFNLFINIYQ